MKPDKQALKALRQERKAAVERAQKTIKTQRRHIEQIKSQVAEKALSVPDIAKATGLASHLVLCYVATLREYGMLVEGAKEGDYFTYGLVAKP